MNHKKVLEQIHGEYQKASTHEEIEYAKVSQTRYRLDQTRY